MSWKGTFAPLPGLVDMVAGAHKLIQQGQYVEAMKVLERGRDEPADSPAALSAFMALKCFQHAGLEYFGRETWAILPAPEFREKLRLELNDEKHQLLFLAESGWVVDAFQKLLPNCVCQGVDKDPLPNSPFKGRVHAIDYNDEKAIDEALLDGMSSTIVVGVWLPKDVHGMSWTVFDIASFFNRHKEINDFIYIGEKSIHICGGYAMEQYLEGSGSQYRVHASSEDSGVRGMIPNQVTRWFKRAPRL